MLKETKVSASDSFMEYLSQWQVRSVRVIQSKRQGQVFLFIRLLFRNNFTQFTTINFDVFWNLVLHTLLKVNFTNITKNSFAFGKEIFEISNRDDFFPSFILYPFF